MGNGGKKKKNGPLNRFFTTVRNPSRYNNRTIKVNTGFNDFVNDDGGGGDQVDGSGVPVSQTQFYDNYIKTSKYTVLTFVPK